MPQLLPPVAHAVDGPRLKEGNIKLLKPGDEGEEPGSHAHPEDDHDHHNGVVRRVIEPLDRVGDKPQTQQQAVEHAVGVAAEYVRPDHIDVARQGRGVKNQHQHRAHAPGGLAEQPGHQEAQQVARRTRDQRVKQGVAQRFDENIVVQKQGCVILQPHESRQTHHVEIGKAHHHRNGDGDDRKHQKQNQPEGQEKIAGAVFSQEPLCFTHALSSPHGRSSWRCLRASSPAISAL